MSEDKKNKLVSDRLNTFFTDNRIMTGSSIPTEGVYNTGDIIVNVGSDSSEVLLWVCDEGGNPGVWSPVGDIVDIIDVNMIPDDSITIDKLAEELKAMLENMVSEDENINVNMIPDGSITMNKIAEDVKNAIEIAGDIDLSNYVTKEDLNAVSNRIDNIDLSGYATKDDVVAVVNRIDNIDLSTKQNVVDDTLQTTDKTIVGAINELFQNANNGKELIANAIGEPISGEDTFSAMSNDINSLLVTFKNNMINQGVTVNDADKFKQLIDKISTITNNTGIGYFTETIETPIIFEYYGVNNKVNTVIEREFGFEPLMVFVEFENMTHNGNAYDYYVIVGEAKESYYEFPWGTTLYSQVTSKSKNSFTLTSYYIRGEQNYDVSSINRYTYHVVGTLGEYDTNRSLLASILEDEGVEVLTSDNLTTLINKVDTEFERQVVPQGTAVANNVLSGKTFINSTGAVVTGAMTNQGNKTITPTTNVQTLPAGYYNSVTINAIGSGYAQYATGTQSIEVTSAGSITVTTNLSFTPNFIVVRMPSTLNDACSDRYTDYFISNKRTTEIYCDYGATLTMSINQISAASFRIDLSGDFDSVSGTATWYAMRV